MSAVELDIGDRLRVRGVWADAASVPVDPTKVEFYFKTPAGVETKYTYPNVIPADAALVRDGVGLYHVDLSLATAGTWWYRWDSTGNIQLAEERTFYVGPSRFTLTP